jgi:large subunit ribosomal protein L6
MSRIAKKPIFLEKDVRIEKIDENNFIIKGPKGSLNFQLPFLFNLEIKENQVQIIPNQKLNKKTKPLWGTLASILKNKIVGVTKGFEKALILEGLGYSAELKGNQIVFKVGFSHPVVVDIPEGINVEIKQEKGKSLIYLRSIDKEKLGNFAAMIKKIKPADRYHAKGFRYANEVIKLKPVKRVGK